jgi:glutamyl-tRNA reductase
MNIVLFGLNHKTAPVEIRERLSIPGDETGARLSQLLAAPEIDEAMILSTCNRVELLACANHIDGSIEAMKEVLQRGRGRAQAWPYDGYCYALVGEEAVAHLFRVASSLDSMVIGEPQILGQIKEAYRVALANKACGPVLNRLLHTAFRVAKRIRTETGIGKRAVSVSYAALELAKSIFGSLQSKTLLLIGAGEMIELACRHFSEQGMRRILVTNRTASRAQELAAQFGGEAVPFELFRKRLTDADIILSCTGAGHYVLDREDVRQALRLRKNRAMFLIDIAVPRDVDPSVNQLTNAYLYDIDDLQAVVDRNLGQRKEEIGRAEEIIQHEIAQFRRWSRSQQIMPVVRALVRKAEEIRSAELAKTLPRLGGLQEDERRSIEVMTRAVVNKILHDPLTRLKREAASGNQRIFMDVVRELFGLEEDSAPTDSAPSSRMDGE